MVPDFVLAEVPEEVAVVNVYTFEAAVVVKIDTFEEVVEAVEVVVVPFFLLSVSW